jgi:PAS domain S-box-containing protein
MVRRAFEAANKIGDLTCAAYCCNQLNAHLLADGDPLAETQREAENGLAFAQKMRFGFIIDVISTQLALIRTLRGLTPKFGCLDDERFDELQIERRLVGNPDVALGECWYWIRKLQARYFAGDYAAALDAASQVQRLLWTSPSPLESAEFHLYGALSHAACCDSATTDPRQQHVEALTAHHRQLEAWAENRPENFESRAALVGAEIARLEGRELDAMRLYEGAIQSARANGFVHHEALAHELAGCFYLQRGFETAGSAHLGHARACYALWGADGKVQQLDELYPRLRQDEPLPDSRATIAAPVEQLELATVLKVSQAVSGEIVLEKLVETVLRTAIAHAGAERGVLIVPRGDDLWIRADARASGSAIAVGCREAPISSTELPESIVRYSARSHECVSVDDASAPGEFSNDAYLRREQSKSVLCLPLLQQGQMMALLYLENHLAAGVFTPARMAVLHVVASQAAMSLEKAQLYEELQKREAKIRRLVDAEIVGVVISNLDGRVIDANDALLKMVGYTRDDLTSGRIMWTDWTPPEWRAVSERAVAQIAAEGKCDLFEKEYVRKDGSRVPVLIAAAAIDETKTENLVFVLDLTERKRAEAAQKCAEAELRQAQTALAHRQRVSMLGEVAASLAHEIRQPIAALMIDATACLRALADHRVDVPEARRAASRIVKEATWADEIITRTSALYRKDTTQRERVDVNAVIRDMAVLLQHEAAASSVSIRTEIADGLPDVIADRVQLQQVFMNLMLNAIEAMKDTGGDLTITSEMREPGELVISVSDKGVGLPMYTPGTIFDAFVTTKPQGTGMGLAITRSIVDAHGGRLWASANAGPGATFFFTLLADGAEQAPSRSL